MTTDVARRRAASAGTELTQGRPGATSSASLQKLGKSLMLPVAVLPVAGILLGVGGAFLGQLPRRPRSTSGYCTVDGTTYAGDVAACLADPGAVGRRSGRRRGRRRAAVHVFLRDPAGRRGPDLRRARPDLRDRRRTRHRQERRRGRARRHGRLPGDERRRSSVIADGSRHSRPRRCLGLQIARHRRVRRHPDRAHRRLRCSTASIRISLPPYLGFFAGKRFVPIVTAFARDRTRHRAGVHLAARRQSSSRTTANNSDQRQRAGRGVRVRARGARAAAVRAAPHLERTVLLRGQRRRLAGLPGHPDLLLPRAPGVRHLRRRLPGARCSGCAAPRWRSTWPPSLRTRSGSGRSCWRRR